MREAAASSLILSSVGRRMLELATTLRDFIAKDVFVSRLARDSQSHARPVLVGPPQEVLEVLFSLLTGNGDWDLTSYGLAESVVVLLVDGNVRPGGSGGAGGAVSERCHWDYAVGIRNSVPLSLTLVSPDAWDSRPESMRNTTETIGQPEITAPGQLLQGTPWPYIIEQVSARIQLSADVIRRALLLGLTNTHRLEPAIRQAAPWVIADDLLGATEKPAVAQLTGLPFCGSSSPTVDELNQSERTLRAIGDLAAKKGLNATEEVLLLHARSLLERERAKPVSERDRDLLPLAPPLKSMFRYLKEQALSGTTLERCPTWYFRGAAQSGEWWLKLPFQKLRRVLDEAGVNRPVGKTKLTCTNALNARDPLDGEPILVTGDVQLEILDAQGQAPAQARVTVRDQGGETEAHGYANGHITIAAVAPHRQPVIVRAEAPNHTPGVVEILSLSTFECGGHARATGAERNPPPTFSRGDGAFVQEIALSRPGGHELQVFCDPECSGVEIWRETQLLASASDNPARVNLELEDGESVEVRIIDAAGEARGSWRIDFLIEEPERESARSRFDALIAAHRRSGRIPAVALANTAIRRLEDAYLASPKSWRGLVGWWPGGAVVTLPIDWRGGQIGASSISTDPRPNGWDSRHARAYLAAREPIRRLLRATGLRIGEIPLSDPQLEPLVRRYVDEYLSWLRSDPSGSAAWVDCIAVHARVPNREAGGYTVSREPAALLLSPLHPLRLAWHCRAQGLLESALSKRCPAAGLLDPHAAPAALGLPLSQGTPLQWRAFFAVSINDPHWALLWNAEKLRSDDEKSSVEEVLESLGIAASGVTGGLTEAQTRRALDDVTQILSARSALRVSVIGSDHESSGGIDGLIQWCRDTFRADENSPAVARFPAACDVIDFREDPSYPSDERLAILGDETNEAVRWFHKGPRAGEVNLDLTILDQLTAMQPAGVPGAARSPAAPGMMFRANIRQDSAGATVLRESRVVQQEGSFGGMDKQIIELAQTLEGTTALDRDTSQIQYEPNLLAIGERLRQARFLAVSSSQVDPACFTRGVAGQGGYLWDYDLPEVLGRSDERAGYYLIATPDRAMEIAVEEAARIVSPAPPPVSDLLGEISVRGIPVLRRVAGGGSQARGEIGVLLAVRLLQDVFRSNGGRVRLPVNDGEYYHLLLPVDSYREPLQQVRKALLGGTPGDRPDVLVFSIWVPSSNGASTHVKVVPLEVKFRDGVFPRSELPAALGQAANLGELLSALWAGNPVNEMWGLCGKALLVQCLDQCFRVYSDNRLHGLDDTAWTEVHRRVLHDVLGGRAQVLVDQKGKLLVFDQSTHTEVLDIDGDASRDTGIVSLTDARALLGSGQLSAEGERAVEDLKFSFGRFFRGMAHADGEAPPSGNLITPSPSGVEVEEPGAGFHPGRVDSGSDARPGAEGRGQRGGSARNPIPPAPRSTGSLIPADVRERVRAAFEGFIGNSAAVRRLSNDLLRALIENPPHLPKNFLFTGQPSTGKTEIARRIAAALDLPFVKLDGRGVTSRERLFELVNGELRQHGLEAEEVDLHGGLPVRAYPPLIVFIDEVHLVPRSVQESFLTLLEASDRTLVLSDHVARMNHTTFMFATTRASDVDRAFRTRCVEVALSEYSLAEVAEILRRRFGHEDWSQEVYLEIARLGRGVPRVAMELAKELETEITVSEYPERPIREHLEEVRLALQLDRLGLTPTDLQYLETLAQEDRPVGEGAILSMMDTADPARISEEVEPLLRRLGFIRLTPRGREITAEGKEYLLARQRAFTTGE